METFDSFDEGILSERQKARNGRQGILVGDFIERQDGLKARVTHVWDDGVQTNTFCDTGEGGRFHLGRSGGMEYSGSLEASVPRTHLELTRSKRAEGRAWFFHHGHSGAHRGVDFNVFVDTYRMLDDNEAIDKTVSSRYILKAGPFEGHCQTNTYTTYDGTERVAYNDGLSLEEYLQKEENKGRYVISSEEFTKLLQDHENNQKTKPVQITEERYMDMLEVLPPERWHDGFFHVSEHIRGNLVSWFMQKDDKYYEFVEADSISKEDLRALRLAA